jgi:hypothetical protein
VSETEHTSAELSPEEIARRNKIWESVAGPIFLGVSERKLQEIRMSAAVQWCEQAGDPQLIKLYDQYLMLRTITQ